MEQNNPSQSILSGQFRTQAETVEPILKKDKLFIGLPKDTILQEKRIALTPSAVKLLSSQGHKVMIERGAGLQSNFSDHEYSEAGAEIQDSKEEVFKANILIKTAPISREEYPWLQMNQVIISPLTIPFATEDYLKVLKSKKIIAIATEYLMDENDSFPIVRSMSEIAGISVISTASELMSTTSGGRGKLFGGISGVPPAKVVILGSGIVAEYASRAALGLGARVHVYDNNTFKLLRLQNSVGRQLYTSTLNLFELQKDLSGADVAIGAVHSRLGRTPLIVTEEMVMSMKKGAVIIDVSIDQGGCFETSEVTSHDKPTTVKHGVIHYCVPNITSRYPRTASFAISNTLFPILIDIAEHGGMVRLISRKKGIKNGVYAFKGCLTNLYLSKRFNMSYTDLDLLLPSEY